MTKACLDCQREFWTNRSDKRYCSGACADRALRRRKGHNVGQRGAPPKDDLTDAQITAILTALAAKRKATRSWLRIENPWAQRPGSELHNLTTVETYNLEGAML